MGVLLGKLYSNMCSNERISIKLHGKLTVNDKNNPGLNPECTSVTSSVHKWLCRRGFVRKFSVKWVLGDVLIKGTKGCFHALGHLETSEEECAKVYLLFESEISVYRDLFSGLRSKFQH